MKAGGSSDDRSEGIIDWLLACPEKGFFEPVPSESTDALKNWTDANSARSGG
jgi:hypothetical protein